MKFLDKYLTIWIFLAMLLGFGTGWIPGYENFVESTSVNGMNLIITIGMILMLIPPFMKINFKNLWFAIKDWKVLLVSLLLNIIIGPFLMFFLSAGILGNDSEVGFRTGIIIVGIARCIAMVIIWNGLAKGKNDYAGAIVAINSIFQLILFLPMTILFADLLPSSMGLSTLEMQLNFVDILKTIGLFLFLPFILAIIIKFIFSKFQTKETYENKTLLIVGLIGLASLLITIFYIFSSKSKEFNSDNIVPIVKIVGILLIYFSTMWVLGLSISYICDFNYQIATTITFTGMGNNFELAIAITLSWFSSFKDASLAATIGPLVEVPIMLLYVKINLLLKNKWNRGNVMQYQDPRTNNEEWVFQYIIDRDKTINHVKYLISDITIGQDVINNIESYDENEDLEVIVNDNFTIRMLSKTTDFALQCKIKRENN